MKVAMKQPIMIALVTIIAVLSGCATRPYIPADNSPLSACFNLYQTLDQNILAAKVADAGIPRVEGLPFLRSSRFLASFAEEAVSDPVIEKEGAGGRYQDWLLALNQQAITALGVETAMLPSNTGELPSVNELERCGNLLVNDLRGKVEWRSLLVKRTQVAPSYHYWQRVLGLYPITAIPFRQGIVRDQREVKSVEENFLHQLPSRKYTYYGVPERQLDSHQLLNFEQNGLGFPQLSDHQREVLLDRFTPVIAVPNGSKNNANSKPRSYDLPGMPTQTGFINDHPKFYSWMDFGRFQGEVTLRLNYSVWFSERPKNGILDLLGGKIDGVTWRVHLSQKGAVLAWDTVHSCGCWYRIYPAEGMQVVADNRFYREPVYVGQALATDKVQKVLYLESGTHHIQAIRESLVAKSMVAVELERFQTLKTQQPQLFSKSGLIMQSRRLERWLFWPMGIPSAGAMRVPGTQAISFIGNRHFDDPYLLEELGLQSQ